MLNINKCTKTQTQPKTNTQLKELLTYHIIVYNCHTQRSTIVHNKF